MTGLKTKTAKLRRTIAVLSTVGLLSVGIVPAATSAHAVAPADSKKTQRIMSGWLPYWITPESVKSFLNNADLFSDVSPFWYNAVTSSKSSSKVAIKSNSLSSRISPGPTPGQGRTRDALDHGRHGYGPHE